MNAFTRYRHDMFRTICEMNGVQPCEPLPKWAIVLRWCLSPWDMFLWSLTHIYDPLLDVITVDGIRMSMEFVRTIANGTPEGRWLRTLRHGDHTETEVTNGGVVRDIVARQREWSQHNFGEGAATSRLLKHIALESDEICAAPNDVEEWCDIVILALDGAWRCGASPKEVETALLAKMEKNRSRIWPKAGAEDQAIEHVKTPL